jgi:AcrR family transcriptional regulator
LENTNDTQQRILDATIECVKAWGVEKTNLNDIAKRAGVTRPTVYNHYGNRTAVIRAALISSGHHFAERMIEHIQAWTNPADRLVEAVVFALEELPEEPYLTVITRADLSAYIYEDALSDREGLEMCLKIFDTIFSGTDLSEHDRLEVMELSVRLALSLLMLSGPTNRKSDDRRGFLRRRLIPAAGL